MTDRNTPIEFRRLTDVQPADVVELLNHPLVRRTLPLARTLMDEADAKAWVEAKERLWTEHGYGPWAFFVNDRFAGWGGLQPEGPDADLGLVLHPRFWGLGRQLVPEIIRRAFSEWQLPSVTVLLPLNRPGTGGLARLGFVPDGEVVYHEVPFARYRLHAASWARRAPGPAVPAAVTARP